MGKQLPNIDIIGFRHMINIAYVYVYILSCFIHGIDSYS